MSAESLSVTHIPVLDHGYVRFVESWGSDERVIEAARMSTAKGFQGWGPIPCAGVYGHESGRRERLYMW